MKTVIKKSVLAQWLVDQNDDCGKDTYFSEEMTIVSSINK